MDLAHPDGQALIRDLAATADVVVGENYKVGTLARYGLDYESLKAINPRLVYCSITGFGQDGPYASLPGYDFVFQGMGGLMSITGQPEGTPGDEPMKVGIAISDLLTGMYATTAILAALERRHVSGTGQHVDMSLARLRGQHQLVSGHQPLPVGQDSAAHGQCPLRTWCRTRYSAAKRAMSSWRWATMASTAPCAS